MHFNRLSDKICISFTNVDVIYYCLHSNFAWIHNTCTIIKCKCIVLCYSWQDSERVLNAGKQMARWSKGLGVRLESKWSPVRFPVETFFSYWIFRLFPFLTVRRYPCKWHKTLTFTCNYCCFRPQIRLIIIIATV